MDDKYYSIPRKSLTVWVARVLLGLGASTSGNGNRSKPVTGQQANNAFGPTHRVSGSVLLVNDGVCTVYAIARYRGGFFDLIPMDIRMSGMDGPNELLRMFYAELWLARVCRGNAGAGC